MPSFAWCAGGWSRAANAHLATSFSESQLQPFTRIVEKYDAATPARAIVTQSCSEDDADEPDRFTRTLRAGPMRSNPGQWTWFNASDLSTLLSDGDCVTAFTADAVTLEGATVDFPPLHMHHIHIERWNRILSPPKQTFSDFMGLDVQGLEGVRDKIRTVTPHRILNAHWCWSC